MGNRLYSMNPYWRSVMARLHVTCPEPGNTRIIYSRLATSLRSLAIILPLYYSTILTSTCATVSTDIPSYEAIHGRMPLHYYRSLISDTFRIRDFRNYPFPTHHDTRDISYRFGSTDRISEVSGYVSWIEVNGNRRFRVDSRGQSARDASRHLWTRYLTDLRYTNRRYKEAWIVHPIEVNSSRDNSELIPEANRPGDASTNKSVEVHFNGFIRELEGYQSRHQRD